MATRDELNALRAEVRRRHRAANAKISRLRSRGVELGGTSFDVRRDLSVTRRYTKQQLTGYLQQLNQFTQRTNNFVPDVEGRPIPIAVWRRDQQAVARYNAKGNRMLDKVGNIKLPFSDMNILQRQNQMLNKNVVRANGEAVNSPYAPIKRGTPASLEALMQLTAETERRNSRTYLPGEIAKQREQLASLLTAIGVPDEIERANALTDEQFNVLFNYTSFVTEASQDYEHAQLMAANSAEERDSRVAESRAQEINETITWAGQLSFGKKKKK